MVFIDCDVDLFSDLIPLITNEDHLLALFCGELIGVKIIVGFDFNQFLDLIPLSANGRRYS